MMGLSTDAYMRTDKFHGNLNQNTRIFIQENAFENVISKMVAIFSRPQWPLDLKYEWVSTPTENIECDYLSMPYSQINYGDTGGWGMGRDIFQNKDLAIPLWR